MQKPRKHHTTKHPPTHFSSTTTLAPLEAICAAVDSPPMPLPMMTASYSMSVGAEGRAGASVAAAAGVRGRGAAAARRHPAGRAGRLTGRPAGLPHAFWWRIAARRGAAGATGAERDARAPAMSAVRSGGCRNRSRILVSGNARVCAAKAGPAISAACEGRVELRCPRSLRHKIQHHWNFRLHWTAGTAPSEPPDPTASCSAGEPSGIPSTFRSSATSKSAIG